MASKILLIKPTIHAAAIDHLQERAELVYAEDGSVTTLVDRLQQTGAEAVVARTEQLPREVIDVAPSLRVIGQHGVGLDNIDVDAATNQGIMVINSPQANIPSTAEHAVALMLAVARRIPTADAAVRASDFQFRDRELPVELTGKRLLVVGLGNIGQAVARICRTAFSMRLLAYDPALTEETVRLLGLEKVDSLVEGLAQADVVTLHVPYMEATHHLIDAEALSYLRSETILVNCARGAVVDEAALVEALRSKRIAGAGLDVFEREPPGPGNPLYELPNAVLTPHYAGDTAEAKRRCSLDLAEDILRALSGDMPRFLANPRVLLN